MTDDEGYKIDDELIALGKQLGKASYKDADEPFP